MDCYEGPERREQERIIEMSSTIGGMKQALTEQSRRLDKLDASVGDLRATLGKIVTEQSMAREAMSQMKECLDKQTVAIGKIVDPDKWLKSKLGGIALGIIGAAGTVVLMQYVFPRLLHFK